MKIITVGGGEARLRLEMKNSALSGQILAHT